MRVLVAGAGGREHALAWKLARSPRVERVLAAPGSAGIAGDATCVPDVPAADAAALAALCRREGVGLVVVGPEARRAEGVADALREQGIPVFGPGRAAARLESSKAFAKGFMARHGIPTAGFACFDALEPARRHVSALDGPCVVKADGLAGGKGVAVCDGPPDALAALDEMMAARRFGDAGARVVVEERLVGQEASYYVLTDGRSAVTLAAAQDYKRAQDDDRGENTGGMGAFAPTPLVSASVEKRVLEEIVHPTLRGLAEEGMPYQGVLYVGLMVDARGAPRVVEYNVRFGDPETQALVLQSDADWAPLLAAAAEGRLEPGTLAGDGRAAVCVVLASGGYPRGFEKGMPITGLEPCDDDPDVVVFHAGTTRDAGGGFRTAGGRVLGVTARAEHLAAARARAYSACERVRFEGMHLRHDIAARAIGH